MANNELTDKQERFCQEYIVDLNATQAAIRAGYSKNSAAEIGCQNLIKLNVAKRIAELKAERSKRVQFTADDLFNELVKVGTSNMEDFIVVQPDGTTRIDMSKCSRDQMAALSEVSTEQSYVDTGSEDEPNYQTVSKIKIKQHSKNQALIELGKHLGVKSGVDVTSNGETVGVDVGVSVERLAASDPGYLEYRQKQILEGQSD